jgi:hypothetical protein
MQVLFLRVVSLVETYNLIPFSESEQLLFSTVLNRLVVIEIPVILFPLHVLFLILLLSLVESRKIPSTVLFLHVLLKIILLFEVYKYTPILLPDILLFSTRPFCKLLSVIPAPYAMGEVEPEAFVSSQLRIMK